MKKIMYSLLTIAFIGFGTTTYAQKKKFTAEHPPHHHPTKPGAQITIANFKTAVGNYVKRQSATNGGYFRVYDNKQKKDLKLKFQKVMPGDLSALGDNKYFMCSDFLGADSNIYDIDVIMKGTNAQNLTAVKKYVHKVNGKPRYIWVETNGIWKMQYLNSKGKPIKTPPQPATKKSTNMKGMNMGK